MLQDTRGDKIFNFFTWTWAAAGYYYQGLAPIRSKDLAVAAGAVEAEAV